MQSYSITILASIIFVSSCGIIRKSPESTSSAKAAYGVKPIVRAKALKNKGVKVKRSQPKNYSRLNKSPVKG